MDPCSKFRKKSYVALIFLFSLFLDAKYLQSQLHLSLQLTLGPHNRTFLHVQFFPASPWVLWNPITWARSCSHVAGAPRVPWRSAGPRARAALGAARRNRALQPGPARICRAEGAGAPGSLRRGRAGCCASYPQTSPVRSQGPCKHTDTSLALQQNILHLGNGAASCSW